MFFWSMSVSFKHLTQFFVHRTLLNYWRLLLSPTSSIVHEMLSLVRYITPADALRLKGRNYIVGPCHVIYPSACLYL
jgi:hypothetical protein